MHEFDLTKLPTDARGWRDFVDWVITVDDRHERHFLELKSEIDLTDKKGRVKVVKFVLGAANRDTESANRWLDGHAVMVLGVRKGSAPGIDSFEVMDLERDIKKFSGGRLQNALWDLRQVPVEGGKDVVIIVVSPPNGEIFPCHADGDNLVNGDLLLRVEGSTRKALGPEITSMFARSGLGARLPDISVELQGVSHLIELDAEVVRARVGREAAALREQIANEEQPGSIGEIVPRLFVQDRRSKEEFLQQVEDWERAMNADPYRALESIAAVFDQPVLMKLTNHSKKQLRGLQVELTLPEGFRAIYSAELEERGEDPILSHRPADWGEGTQSRYIESLVEVIGSESQSGPSGVEIIPGQPTKVVFKFDDLRSESEVMTARDNGVVIALFGSTAVEESIPLDWSLTAEGVHDIKRGKAVLPTVCSSWNERLQAG